MKILVYDCEIIKAVPIAYKNEAKIEGIEYCEGWHDHTNMGISVIGTYNNWNKEQIAFVNYEAMHMGYPSMEDLKLKTIKHFQDLLNECDILVGFNSIRFDNLLIEANGFTIPTHIKQYDILQEMWQAAGLGPDFTFPYHAGYSLKQTCKVNDLPSKSGDGVNAAIDWQRGKYEKVIRYCLNDVMITTELLRKIQGSDGWIVNPKNKLKLRKVQDV